MWNIFHSAQFCEFNNERAACSRPNWLLCRELVAAQPLIMSPNWQFLKCCKIFIDAFLYFHLIILIAGDLCRHPPPVHGTELSSLLPSCSLRKRVQWAPPGAAETVQLDQGGNPLSKPSAILPGEWKQQEIYLGNTCFGNDFSESSDLLV